MLIFFFLLKKYEFYTNFPCYSVRQQSILFFVLEDCLNVEKCSEAFLPHFIIFQVFHLISNNNKTSKHSFFSSSCSFPTVIWTWSVYDCVFSIDKFKSQIAIFCINIYMFICVCYVDVLLIYLWVDWSCLKYSCSHFASKNSFRICLF